MSTPIPLEPAEPPTEVLSKTVAKLSDAVKVVKTISTPYTWSPDVESKFFKLIASRPLEVGQHSVFKFDATSTRLQAAMRGYYGILPIYKFKFVIICGPGVTGQATFTRVAVTDLGDETTPLVKHIQPFVGTTVVDLHTRARTYEGCNSTISYLTINPRSEVYGVDVKLDTLNTGVLYPNMIRVELLVAVELTTVTKPIGLNYMESLDSKLLY